MSPKLVKTAIYYLYALAEPVLKFKISAIKNKIPKIVTK